MTSNEEFDKSVEGMKRFARENKLADRDPEDVVLQAPAVRVPEENRCYLCSCELTLGTPVTIRKRKVCELCAITLEVMVDVLKADFIRSRISAMNDLNADIRNAITARGY